MERYLFRGRFDVEQTYQCAVSWRTSTNGARDEELAVLESVIVDLQNMQPRTQKMSKICAGYLASEPSDDAGRRCLENREAARFSSLACRRRTKLGCP